MSNPALENMSSLPPMTTLEISIIQEWCKPKTEEFNVITLVNVMRKHLNNATGNSYSEKIKNLDFTIIDNNKFKNPFVQILTMCYLRQQLERNDNGHVHDMLAMEIEKNNINNLIAKFWDELLEYLNIYD